MGTPIPQGARWLGLPVLATLVAGAGCAGAGGGTGGAGGPSDAGVDAGAPAPVDAVNTADQPGAPPRRFLQIGDAEVRDPGRPDLALAYQPQDLVTRSTTPAS